MNPKFKVGDWVRIRKDTKFSEYPSGVSQEADDLVQVLDRFPDATTLLLIVTAVNTLDSLNVQHYDCAVHPMFPWHDALLVLGSPPDEDDINGRLTIYECELEPYDSDASLDNRNGTEPKVQR